MMRKAPILLLTSLLIAVMPVALLSQQFPLRFEAPRSNSFGGYRFGSNFLYPNHVEVADVNEDGLLDILTDTSYRLANADGVFGPEIRNNVEGTGLATGELNGDENIDFVISSDECVFYYRGDGLGGFEQITLASLGEPTTGVVLSDLDQDGHQDIVVLHAGRR